MPNDKRIFRELAISAIGKSHAAIKGCWLVVFAGKRSCERPFEVAR